MKTYNLHTGKIEDSDDKIKVYNLNTQKITVLPYSNKTLKQPASMFKAPTLTGGGSMSAAKSPLPTMADFKKLDYAQSKGLKPAVPTMADFKKYDYAQSKDILPRKQSTIQWGGKTDDLTNLPFKNTRAAEDYLVNRSLAQQEANRPVLTAPGGNPVFLMQGKDYRKQLGKHLSAQLPQREFGAATEEFMNDLNAQLEADMGLREQPVTRQSISQAEENLMALQRQSVPFAATSGFVKSMADLPAVMIPFTPEQRAQYNAPFAQTAELHPLAYGAGQFAGEAIKYGTAAKMVEGMPVLQEALGRFGGKVSSALSGKVSAEVISRLAAGRISDLPLDVIYAAQETDNPQDFAKNLGINTAMGLGTDVGLETIGKLWRMGKTAAASNAPGGENWYNRKMDELKDPFGVAPETKPGYNQGGGDLSGGQYGEGQPGNAVIQGMEANREVLGIGADIGRTGNVTRIETKSKRKTFEFEQPSTRELNDIQASILSKGQEDGFNISWAKNKITQIENGKKTPVPGKGVYLGDGKMILAGDGESYRHELFHYLDEVIPEKTSIHRDNVQFYANTSDPAVAEYLKSETKKYQEFFPNFKDEDIWGEIGAAVYNDPDAWDGFFTDQEAIFRSVEDLDGAFSAYKTGRSGGTGGKTSNNKDVTPEYIKGLSLDEEFNKGAYGRFKKSSEITDSSVSKYVDQLYEMAPRNGYTKEQWLENARQIGAVSAQNEVDIERVAYESWFSIRPNQKGNFNRQGKKYVPFNVTEWVNKVKEGALQVNPELGVSRRWSNELGGYEDFESFWFGHPELSEGEAKSAFETGFAPLPEAQKPIVHLDDPVLPYKETPTLNGYGKNTVGAAESGQTRTQKTSKVYENTFQNTPLFTAAEKNAANLNNMQLDYRYDVIGERQSLKEAAQRLQVDYAGEVADLPNKARFDGVDTDTAVMILRDLTEKARQTGDYSEVKKWAKMIQERGTEAGQSIQAFAKYSRTPEGVAVKAQKAVSDEFDKFAAKDPNLAKAMDDLANRLEQIAKEYQYDLPADPQQAAQRLREAVENVMNDKSYRRLKLDESFSDRVIKALQDSRSGKDVYADIIKEFEGIPTLSGEDLMQIMDIMAEAEKLPLYSKARLDVENQAYKIVADKFNSSFMDKWNAWRYIAMLGNTRTHIRNLVGNTLFGGVTRIKNDVGALVEGAVDKTSKRLGGEGIQRTKVLINPFDIKDRAIKTAANSDFENMYALITGGGKYNPSDMIRDNQTVFKTKWLEKLRKGNSNLLELEDSVALRARYTENLTRYIKANGYDASIFANSSKQAQDVLDAARGYAIEQAQKATFRDYNGLAAFLNRASRQNKAANIVIEGVLPFKKTPANIVRRGVEYSPAGLAKGILDMRSAITSGRVSASQAIDELAAGLTGTGIMALGAFLASKGLLTGSGSDNSKERGFDALRGNQNYALKIGNRSYTLDWMAPASLPLFIGVELNSLFQEDGLTLDNALDAMTRITEPVLEMTMLQGMDDMIKSARYNETSALASVGLGAMTNYFTQAIPTAFGQVARASDPLRRTIYNEPDSRLPKFLDTARQRAQAKIPDILPWKDPLERFTSKGLQPKTDQWGREQENVGGNFPGRLAYNMLSPGYYSETRSTDADQLISSLYEQTGETGILPSNAQKSFRVDGETINLTGDQYTQVNRLRGQTARELLDAAAESAYFNSLSQDDQIDAVADVYSYASAMAKADVSSYQPAKWMLEARQSADRAGLTTGDYIARRAAYNNILPIEDAEGNVLESRTDRFRKELLDDDSILPRQKKELDKALIGSKSTPDYSSGNAFILSGLTDSQQEKYSGRLAKTLTPQEYAKALKAMGGSVRDKKTGKAR